MEAFFVGLFILIVGILLVLRGYKLFRVLMPLWGFFAGFSWGAQALSIGLGTGFPAKILEGGEGLIFGCIMAVFAYLSYELAVGILAGFVGYWLIAAFMLATGFTQDLFMTIFSTIIGVFSAFEALHYRAPKGLLIFLTSLAGAAMAVSGILVMSSQLPLTAFGISLFYSVLLYSSWWTGVWVVLVAIGITTQLWISEELYVNTMRYSTGMRISGIKGGRAKREAKKIFYS